MRRAVGALSVPSCDEKRLAQWRGEIVRLRIKLVDLPIEKQRELWTVIDCRETCIRLGGADFAEQLERIDREIERALRR
jgi:predicted aspartyl protease